MNFSPKRIVLAVGAVFAFIMGIWLIGNMSETVGADEIVIMQNPLDGKLNVWATPGWRYQNFGKLTRYKKSAQYWFSSDSKEGKADDDKSEDQSIKVRFNDGGHANVSGSLRFDLPVDDEHMKQLHIKYGSMEAIEHALIRTSVTRSVFMTGPLMSSKESYAEKRSAFIQYAEDQLQNGVYQTTTQDAEVVDQLSGAKKTVTIVKLVPGDGGKGFARQESSVLEQFGIRVYNFSINDIKYSDDVEKQIQSQQQALANVQTAIAQAKKAEQDAITIAKQGEANAAKAKWAQETEKATAVTKAEQEKEVAIKDAERERDVAKLERDAAEQTKQKEILLGEGEAAHKRLVMQADGALTQKLNAWVEVNKYYAEKFGQQSLVPEIQIGGGAGPGTTGQTAANNLIDLLQVKTARDLQLDLHSAKK